MVLYLLYMTYNVVFIRYIYTCLLYQKKHKVPMTLELLEDGGWSRSSNKYARLSSKNNASTRYTHTLFKS